MAQEPVGGSLRPGLLVRVQGLSMRADLNGEQAELVAWVPPPVGRWNAKICATDEAVQIKPQNLSNDDEPDEDPVSLDLKARVKVSITRSMLPPRSERMRGWTTRTRLGPMKIN